MFVSPELPGEKEFRAEHPSFSLSIPSSKVTWPGNRTWTDLEDVFPIENGEFPIHPCQLYRSVGDFPVSFE